MHIAYIPHRALPLEDVVLKLDGTKRSMANALRTQCLEMALHLHLHLLLQNLLT